MILASFRIWLLQLVISLFRIKKQSLIIRFHHSMTVYLVTALQIAIGFSTCHLGASNEESLALIDHCYDSPTDLFQVYPQLNSTFKIKIKNKCLQMPSLEIYLFAIDISIVDQIYAKEVDQLDSTKVNSIKINRPVMIFGQNELSNFKLNSKFKFAIVFFDHTGDARIALHPKVFNFYSGQLNSSTTEIFLIIILGILLLITCILLAILIYINYFGNGRLQNHSIFWKKNHSHKLLKVHLLSNQENNIETTFEPKSNIIIVDKLINLIPGILEEENLREEYNSVPKSKLHSWNHGRLPEHKSKNRYGNLLPYDHSRVVLTKESLHDSDYINANFIDGYEKPNRYIAMQGPIDTTIIDFWRCVWQLKCHQIVMLTNLEENGKIKCDKYWPDVSQFYGKIKVTLQSSELFADYIIRNFVVEKEGDKLMVVQYHFVSWPDHTVPMYACTLISFINRIRMSTFYADICPIVVHCSAGIGRTGAYILIDSMLEMANNEKKIDVVAHLCRMRLQRINMVELSQYVFVYQVLVEALSHQCTDIRCSDFANYLDKLVKGSEKHCALYKQFEVLNVISIRKLSADVCKSGLLNCKLNRKQDVTPPDYARVILPNHEDYVNAVYVNGYRKQDAYIVTQIPFENNRQQFWKMIEQTGCVSIVLLGEINADEQIYWPSYIHKKFDFNCELTVTLQQEENYNSITLRTFLLKPSDLIVRQFHLRDLAGQLFLSCSTNLLIELREMLEQFNLGNSTTPLVIQCLDGVQLSGLFCAADFILERIKEEQQIDVFLAVQKIRANRPQFIVSYEQYLFLHQLALEYLQSFDQYANFK